MTVAITALRLFQGFQVPAGFQVTDDPAEEVDGAFHGPAVEVLVVIVREHVGTDYSQQRPRIQLRAHQVKRDSDPLEIRALEGEEYAMITPVIRQVTAVDVDRHRGRGEYFLTYIPGPAHQHHVRMQPVEKFADLITVYPVDGNTVDGKAGPVCSKPLPWRR